MIDRTKLQLLDVGASALSRRTFSSILPEAPYQAVPDLSGGEGSGESPEAHSPLSSAPSKGEDDIIGVCYVPACKVRCMADVVRLIRQTIDISSRYAVIRLHLFDGLEQLWRHGLTTFSDRHAPYAMRPSLADVEDLLRILGVTSYIIHGVRPIRSFHHHFVVPINDASAVSRPLEPLDTAINEEIQIIVPRGPLCLTYVPFIDEMTVEVRRRQDSQTMFTRTVAFCRQNSLEAMAMEEGGPSGAAGGVRICWQESPHVEVGRPWTNRTDSRGDPVYRDQSIDKKHYIAEIEGAVIAGDFASVITANGTLVSESMYLKFSPNNWLHNRMYSDLSFINKEFSSSKLYAEAGLAATIDRNSYYHWHVDVLPAIAMLRQFSQETGRRFPVLAKMPDAFQIESAATIAGHLPRLPIEDALVSVGRLYFPSPLRGDSNAARQSAATRSVFETLRADVTRRLGMTQSPERIYVARLDAGNRRRIVNERELADALEGLGFAILAPGQVHDYTAERATFMNAKIIIGPTGAGMTNLAFAAPGATVVELMPDNYRNDCYMRLCNTLEIDYFAEVMYNMDTANDDPHLCSWRVDVPGFINWLKALSLV